MHPEVEPRVVDPAGHHRLPPDDGERHHRHQRVDQRDPLLLPRHRRAANRSAAARTPRPEREQQRHRLRPCCRRRRASPAVSRYADRLTAEQQARPRAPGRAHAWRPHQSRRARSSIAETTAAAAKRGEGGRQVPGRRQRVRAGAPTGPVHGHRGDGEHGGQRHEEPVAAEHAARRRRVGRRDAPEAHAHTVGPRRPPTRGEATSITSPSDASPPRSGDARIAAETGRATKEVPPRSGAGQARIRPCPPRSAAARRSGCRSAAGRRRGAARGGSTISSCSIGW